MVEISLKRALFFLVALLFISSVLAQDQPKTPRPSPLASQSPSKEKIQDQPTSQGKFSMMGQDIHLSCNRSIRDLKNQKMECFGNVYIKRPSELLTADYAVLDMKNEQLHAEGNVVYFTSNMVIYGAKMDYNFIAGTGVIEDGRIESERYQLLGEKIERLSEDHFRAWDGEYTTCRDCPASWKIAGDKVDLTVEQYAHLKNVYIKIKDASSLYLPYAIIPVKSKRQSGFLFPKWQLISPHGFTFMQPFFWSISRSTDATLSAGYYSLRGFKGEGQFRYMLGPRSHGEFNGYYLRDKSFIEHYENRWALKYEHNVVFPWKIEQKLKWLDTSDRDYVRNFPSDVPGRGEQGLMSTGSLSRTSRLASSWVVGKRIRNNLTQKKVGFDPNTVQLAPGFTLSSTDHRVFDSLPLHWGVTGTFNRFYRIAPSYDPLYPIGFVPPSQDLFLPGETPIRRAERYTLTPELYYTARIADVFEWIPSMQYRTYHYRFDKNVVGSTNRGYLIVQNELATTVEQVYGGQVKHKFRPSLVYSRIPLIQQDQNHPFIRQIKRGGYQFDEYDIVPITSDTQVYFVPLGNSLTYRLGNKFILKSDKAPYTYRKAVDVAAGQSINFIELQKSPHDRQPLSRFFTLAAVDTEKVTGTGEYYYYPYIRASTYNLGVTYMFVRLQNRFLIFQRSLSLNYNYNQVTTHAHSIGGSVNFSINDYFAATGGISYTFPMILQGSETPGRVMSVNLGMSYQSPSQCYKLVVTASRTVDNPVPTITFNVPINLTGDGFMEFN